MGGGAKKIEEGKIPIGPMTRRVQPRIEGHWTTEKTRFA